jgi:hypothetical protein
MHEFKKEQPSLESPLAFLMEDQYAFPRKLHKAAFHYF